MRPPSSPARDGAIAGLIAAAGALTFALLLGLAWEDGLPRLGLAGMVRPSGGSLALGLAAHLVIGAAVGALLFVLNAHRPSGALAFSAAAALFCVAVWTGGAMGAKVAGALLAQHVLFGTGLALALPSEVEQRLETRRRRPHLRRPTHS